MDWGGYYTWHGAWHEQHTLSREQSQPQTLWVHYEKLVADPSTEIARVAAFLGVSMEGEAGHALLQRVVEGSSFKKMKQQADTASSSGTRSNTSAHLRNGVVRGDSQSHFDRSGCEHLRGLFYATHELRAPGLPAEHTADR